MSIGRVCHVYAPVIDVTVHDQNICDDRSGGLSSLATRIVGRMERAHRRQRRRDYTEASHAGPSQARIDFQRHEESRRRTRVSERRSDQYRKQHYTRFCRKYIESFL